MGDGRLRDFLWGDALNWDMPQCREDILTCLEVGPGTVSRMATFFKATSYSFEKLVAQAQHQFEKSQSLEIQLAEANDEITTLRESLAWYGDEGNWKGALKKIKFMGGPGTVLRRIAPITEDKGQRARDVLGGRDAE